MSYDIPHTTYCSTYDFTHSIISRKSSIIGIDLGGTKIAAARYNATTWEIEDRKQVDTHAQQEFPHVYNDMLELIEQLRTDDVTHIGIGVPGLVDTHQGTVLQLPNIPGSDAVSLESDVVRDTGLQCKVDNDANCFVLAESLQGVGKGHSVIVGIAMGTGVGGGIVIDGKIFHGAHGYASEIGHMLLMPGNPPYASGNARGEVEQFFSGTAMGKRCQEASDPNDYLEGSVCSFMHKDIFKEVAWMCTNLIHLIDPSIIIFGGSAGHALKPHLASIANELEKWLLPGTPIPKLAIAELEDAGTRGAALLYN